jgi:hypothetical protein
VVLIHDGKHGVDVLKVVDDKLMLHFPDRQHGNFDGIAVEVRNQLKWFSSAMVIWKRERVSRSQQRGVFGGMDPWVGREKCCGHVHILIVG